MTLLSILGEGSDYVYALPKRRSKSKYLWRMSKSKIIAKSPSFRQASSLSQKIHIKLLNKRN